MNDKLKSLNDGFSMQIWFVTCWHYFFINETHWKLYCYLTNSTRVQILPYHKCLMSEDWPICKYVCKIFFLTKKLADIIYNIKIVFSWVIFNWSVCVSIHSEAHKYVDNVSVSRQPILCIDTLHLYDLILDMAMAIRYISVSILSLSPSKGRWVCPPQPISGNCRTRYSQCTR